MDLEWLAISVCGIGSNGLAGLDTWTDVGVASELGSASEIGILYSEIGDVYI